MAYTSNRRRMALEFSNVYLPEHSSESLLIPEPFVSLCNRLLPKTAVLSNRMGCLWPVSVDYIDGRLFFVNGWKKFVKDNSIQSGDILIFRYDDDQCGFSVKVFGQDACEKIENKTNGTSYMNKVKIEDEEERQKEEETEENDSEDEDCDDYDDGYVVDSDYEYFWWEQEEAIKNRGVGKRSAGNIGGSKKRDAVPRKSRGGNSGSNKRAAVKDEPGFKQTNPIHIGEEESSTIGAGKQSYGNNGLSEKIPLPSFIAQLKPGRERNLLFVPMEVLELAQHKISNPIFFRNKNGVQWPGDVIIQKHGRIFIRGWNDFCIANQVSMDDWCICEFAQGNNQETNVIDVQILCKR